MEKETEEKIQKNVHQGSNVRKLRNIMGIISERSRHYSASGFTYRKPTGDRKRYLDPNREHLKYFPQDH